MATTREKIVSALTQYDEKEYQRSLKNPRARHNPSALALYLEALERAENEAAELKGPFAYSDRLIEALKRNFCDRLLTVVLKAANA